jgi:hypothetical protein
MDASNKHGNSDVGIIVLAGAAFARNKNNNIGRNIPDRSAILQ